MNKFLFGICPWLIVGIALGYVLALYTNSERDSAAGASILIGESNTVFETEAGANDASAKNIATQAYVENHQSAGSGTTHNLNKLPLQNSQLSETGFSAQHEFMNQLANAGFDQLEAMALQVLQKPLIELTWTSSDSLALIGLRMLELDRDKTVSFLQRSIITHDRRDVLHRVHEVIALLARTHHDELLAWSESTGYSGDRYQIRSMVFQGMARSDPEAAMVLAATYDQQGYVDSQYVILNTWSVSDPEAAMDWVMTQGSVNAESGQIEMVFTHWLTIDNSAAMDFLEGIEDADLKSRLETQFMMELAQRSPQEALTHATTLENRHSRQMTIESAMYSWGERSLFEAIDYATHSLSGADQQQAFRILGDTASMYGHHQLGDTPVEVMQRSDALPAGLRETVRRNTIDAFFQQDAQAALQWLDSVPDAQERNELFSSVAWQLAEYDLAAAQVLFDQSDEVLRSQLGPGIAQQMYLADPVAAWHWQQSIGDPVVSHEVMMGLMYTEALENPDQAMQKVLNSPSGDSPGTVMPIFSSAAFANPEWAVQWVPAANVNEQLRAMMMQVLNEIHESEGPYSGAGLFDIQQNIQFSPHIPGY